MSPPPPWGASDSSSDSTSLLFSLTFTRQAISFCFSYFCRDSSAFFFFLASAASFWVAYRAMPSGPLEGAVGTCKLPDPTK